MSEIAAGIRRIGDGVANSYIVEDGGEVTIVDAGMAGYWKRLPAELAALGRTIADVRAVVLTHGHGDHIGFAERARRERSLPVRVHTDDAELARGKAGRTGGLGPFRLRPLVAFLVFGFRNGGNRVKGVKEVVTFDDDATLDVPGSLRVIHTPGHTAGSVVLLLEARGAIFVGDAFVTRNVLTGNDGPQLFRNFSKDVRQAYASLDRLDGIDASLVLPGHGEPWRNGLDEALRVVRAAGPPD